MGFPHALGLLLRVWAVLLQVRIDRRNDTEPWGGRQTRHLLFGKLTRESIQKGDDVGDLVRGQGLVELGLGHDPDGLVEGRYLAVVKVGCG